jgi:muramoyltetrapeptide carboxypeptidase
VNPTLVMPSVLVPGDNVRVVSPASPMMSYVPDRLRRAESTVRGLGLRVSYGRHAYDVSMDGAAAGSAEQRAADLMEAFEDPSVQAIFCSDAGEGSAELVPYLDPDRIRGNPKPFVGYSDNVFLNQYLLSRAGLVSYYGYTFLHHMGEVGGAFPETLDNFRAAVMTGGDLWCRPASSRTSDWYSWVDPAVQHLRRERKVAGGYEWLRPGRAEGPLVGAALPLIPELIRRFGLQVDSAVLFWDVNLYNEVPVRRLLADVCECADLSKLAGMVVGAHQLVPPRRWAAEVADDLAALLPGARFPVMVNADLSHLCPSWLVPYGARVVLGTGDGLWFQRGTDRGA